MKRNKIYYLICVSVLLIIIFCGCSAKSTEQLPIINEKLIYKETISPNKEYVTSEEDIVNFIVEIYQDNSNNIIVTANSNSLFFEEMLYEVDYDKEISESDINIEWTTLMGNPEATEEDQLVIAKVSFSENGEIFSQRKINFMNKGIELMIDAINNNK